MAVLNDVNKAQLFKELAKKSSYEAGLVFGLDKHYKNAQTVGSTVIRIFNEVKNNPEKFNISPDTCELVISAVEARSALTRKGEARTTLREKLDETKGKTFEELALDNRAKAAQLMSLRLDDVLSTKKKRQLVSLGEAAKVFGIHFDKGQLIEGKATEHVSMMSKLDTASMTPGQAMDMVLKMREYNQVISQEATKK